MDASAAGNTSSTSSVRRKLQTIQFIGALVTAAFEVFVLAEILWYYLHDEEQTMHEAFREWLQRRREHRAAVRETRDSIRSLPERDDDAT